MWKSIALAGTTLVCLSIASLSLATAPPPGSPKPAPPADKPAQKEAPPTIAQGQELLGAEQFEEAAAVFHKIVKADPDNSRAWHLLGFSHHAGGNLTDALPAHLMATEFPQTAPISSYNVACVYALRKKTDKAFAWLEKSRLAGFINLEQVEGDSDLDSLRSDPRFATYLEAVKKAEAEGGGMPEVRSDTAGRPPVPADKPDGGRKEP